MKRFGGCLLWGASWLVATLLATSGLLFALTRPSLRVVHTWTQPDTVSYQSFDPYHLSVVEGDLDWRGFPFNVTRRYFIYVGIEAGQPTYGHVLDYSFHPLAPIEDHIRLSKVEWAPEGVTFREASGHVLFIPKAMFIGGR